RHNYFIQKPKVRLTKTSRWFDNLAVCSPCLRKWLVINQCYKVNEYFDSSVDIPF
ncbi:hypothetical protein C0J52_18266, partial [Blattella germanica]